MTRRVLLPLLISLFTCITLTNSAAAASGKELLSNTHHSKQHHRTPVITPSTPKLAAKAFVLMDANSGKILAQKDPHVHMAPASLTKMMTLYITFQALKSGQIKLEDKAYISKKAWKMRGSRLFLRVGSHVPIKTLIRGAIVVSGNDACVALAEHIAGNETTFAELMNQTAARLHMNDSHFVDSTGWPNPEHYSSAYDLSLLAQALIRDFPEYYHFFKEKWMRYNGIKQPNRNRLLWRDASVDGIKTGHTESAGYCLVSSAKRHDMRIISTLMGTKTDKARASESEALLNYGFRFYQTIPLFNVNDTITQARVWKGDKNNVALGVAETSYLTYPRGQYDRITAEMSVNQHLSAPITEGDTYGNVILSFDGKPIKTVPLIAKGNVAKGHWLKRAKDHVHLAIKKWMGN